METKYLNEINNLLYDSESQKRIELLYKDIFNSHIFIYGAGNAGTMTNNILKQDNIDIEGFIDKSADYLSNYMNKPVYKMEELSLSKCEKKRVLIIIAFLCSYDELENMKEKLIKLGYMKILYYHDIYYYHDIFNLITTNDLINGNVNNKKINLFKSEKNKIFKVNNLLSDKKSKEVYYNFLNSIVNCNPDLFSKPENDQYFVNDIIFRKGYSRFIDCGAFDGDTAIDLKKHKGQIEKIALFEPDNNNFKKLVTNLNETRVADEQIIYPCGVWKSTKALQFKSGNQTTSAISDDGNIFIQCVALDEVLGDFSPTFIKMDIEGAEYEALLGAYKTIKKYKPDLAISVYHKIEHLWMIPLLINKFNSNYRFYLRSHALHGMETILYAVCEE